MKLKHISILLVLVSGIIVSCSDRFFVQYPSNNITEGNNYQTENDFNQAIIGCYARLKTGVSFHHTLLAYRSDEAIQEQMATSNQNQYDFDHFQENASCGIMSDIWDNWYSGIYRCNDVLDHINDKEFEKQPQFKAEALFIRSWFYFNLYRCFGGVPLATSVVNPDEAKFIPRCSEDEIYRRLVEDLIFAAENLPVSRGNDKARVTRIAAQALLGKVHLTFARYAEAETVLAEAMNDPWFGLMPTTGDAFKVENKMNKEIIFALYYNKTNGNGHDFWWDSTSEARDRTNPTQTLRNLYDAEDNRLPLIRDYIYSSPRYVMTKWYDEYDTVYTEQVSNDFPHLRYADVVLMRAEALIRQDRLEEALTYLNMTRSRAGIAEKTIDDFRTQKEFIRELADERGREFALEGQRWFDLVRLGLAVEYFSELDYNVDEHNLIFPIPNDQIEIVNNTDILWQNPGY